VKDGGSPNRETQQPKHSNVNPVVDDFSSSSNSKISEEFNRSSSDEDEEERSILVIDTQNQHQNHH